MKTKEEIRRHFQKIEKYPDGYVEEIKMPSIKRKTKSNNKGTSAILLIENNQQIEDTLEFTTGMINGHIEINEEGNVITFFKNGFYRFELIGEIFSEDNVEIKFYPFPEHLQKFTTYEVREGQCEFNFSTILEVSVNERIVVKMTPGTIVIKGFRLLITNIR